jgi:hypothetical protein
MFVLGCCAVGRWGIGYIYMMEFWSQTKIKTLGPCVNVVAGLSLLMGTIIISSFTRDTVWIEYAALTLTAFGLLGSLWLLPESPKFLLDIGENEKAIAALNYVAKVNGI